MAQPALFQAAGVENLVAPAGPLGIGHQQQRLAQGLEFAQGVAPRTAEHQVGAGQHVGQIRVQELHLGVAGGALQRRVEVSLAADVRHIEGIRQPGQRLPQGLVHGLRAGGAPHHQ